MRRTFCDAEDEIIKADYIAKGGQYVMEKLRELGLKNDWRSRDIYQRAITLGLIEPAEAAREFSMPRIEGQWPKVKGMLKCA